MYLGASSESCDEVHPAADSGSGSVLFFGILRNLATNLHIALNTDYTIVIIIVIEIDTDTEIEALVTIKKELSN